MPPNLWSLYGLMLKSRLFEEAIALDPTYATAYYSLSVNHYLDVAWFEQIPL